jgi:hypothetical protein
VYLIATDILADLSGLSLGLIITLIPVGAMLWLLGWWSHRFWIVLTATVLAGVIGLLEGATWQAQPIVVAVLLAIAAGVLALALVRVFTFAAGGFAGMCVVQAVMPTLNQQVVCFLVSGLLSLLLFRWYFMALTSFAGSVVLAYGTLALLHYHELMDALRWADENAMLLNILCGAGAVSGLGFQFFFDRWRRRRRAEAEEEGEEDLVSAVLGRIGFGGESRKAA